MLARLFVPAPGLSPAEVAELHAEFPTVEVGDGAQDAAVDATAWADPFLDPGVLDGRVAEAAAQGAFGLRTAADVGIDHLALLTRYQRFVGRRNHGSAIPLFDRILAAHRALHDLDRPLCRADHEHALDTWQWLLRLCPEASLELQAAALFHDVERLVSEALVRVEQHAQSYQDFKDAHARRGASIARTALASLGLGKARLDRIAELVAGHERPRTDPEGAALNAADGLSFFSLNSSGFLDYYGADHTRRKVAYTLARLSPDSRVLLGRIRLRHEVRAMVHAEGG